jgi:transposase
MGWVTMSERDLKRIEVLTDVRAGRRTVAAAAVVLTVSERQAYRLLARYETDGGGAELVHKARGHSSNRGVNAGVRKYAIELVRTRYADFGPTLAAEVLLEKHETKIGRETLRRWISWTIPSLLRATPSATSEHLLELLGSSPIPLPSSLLAFVFN